MNALEKAFNVKTTENGDIAYNSTGNELLDILFMSSYFEKHLEEIPDLSDIGISEVALFSMFIRDPRLGFGRRDLGRALMNYADVPPKWIVKAGRFDDLFQYNHNLDSNIMYLKEKVEAGNMLAKKWCPRLTGKNRATAKYICKKWRVTEKEYRKMIKVETVERQLTEKRTDDIDFSHVPSLAMIKYYSRFINGTDTCERFNKYIANVKDGKEELHVSTTTVYDIYRNRDKIDPDLFYDKMEKISLNCVPIIDVSGSMYTNDNIGKALSIGMYLSNCSTYCKDQFVTFSENPKLVKLKGSNYAERIANIVDNEWGFNTDFGKVMKLFTTMNEFPEYLVVLSDMEFDYGSAQGKDQLEKLWREKGYNTKIVWWNFNERHTTVPEMDSMGNIYLSGYNPMLLKYLEAGFDGNEFLEKLLKEYLNKIMD